MIIYESTELFTCVSCVDVQPHVVFLANGSQFYEIVEGTRASGSQSSYHATRYQTFLQILLDRFQQCFSPKSAFVIGL